MFIAFVYLGIALFSLRSLLFTPGVIGHNWDWVVPWFPSFLRHLFADASYLWWDFSLGQADIFRLNITPFSFFLSFWGFLGFSGDFVSKFITFFSVTVACLTMFFLAADLLEEMTVGGESAKRFIIPAAFLAGLFYGFSPFLFQELIGGATTGFFTYALSPLVLLFFRRRNHFATALVLTLLIASLQVFVLIITLLFLYSLRDYKKDVPFLVVILFLTFLFNLYWLVPAASFSVPAVASWSQENKESLLNAVRYAVPSLREIFIATGYFRPLFTMSIVPDFKPFWELVSYFLVILVVFIANIFLSKGKKPLFWLAFLLFSFIPVTGGKSPLGGIVLWLYENFPPMALFRSPQHLILWPTFVFAILIGTGSYFLFLRFSARWRRPLFIFLILGITIWVHPFILYGDLGRGQLRKRYLGGNYVDIYRLSPDFQETLEYLEKQQGDFRVLVLPMTVTPYYLDTPYQLQAQGGDPHLFRASKPMVVADFMGAEPSRNFLETVEREFYLNHNPLFLKNFLSLTNTAFVILRKDVVANFGFGAAIWDYPTVSRLLEESPFLERIKEGEYVRLYRVKEISPSHFYIPKVYWWVIDSQKKSLDIATFEDMTTEPTVYSSAPVWGKDAERVLVPLLTEVMAKESLTSFNEEIAYPYVRIKPGTVAYFYVWAKEWILENREKNPPSLLDLKLFYAAKRVSEAQKWGRQMDGGEQEKLLEAYRRKMSEALVILEQHYQEEKRQADWRALAAKYGAYLEDNSAKLKQAFPQLPVDLKEFTLRLGKIQADLEKMQTVGKFTVPEEGIYQFLVTEENHPREIKRTVLREVTMILDGTALETDNVSLTDGLIKAGEVFLPKGSHTLTVSLPPEKNLVGEGQWGEMKGNQVIESADGNIESSFLPINIFPEGSRTMFKEIDDYAGSGLFQISFDYQVEGGKVALIVVDEREEDPQEGKRGKKLTIRINMFLPKTEGGSSRRFVTDFWASQRATAAQVYLVMIPDREQFGQASFKNIKVERLWAFKLLARLSRQASPSATKIATVIADKVSPVKYRLQISGANKPYTLVFSESFHPGWQLYFEESNTPLPEERHRLVNSYANAWEITLSDSQNRENYKIVVKFTPQDKVFPGVALSLVSIFGAGGYSLWKFLRKTSP